MAFVREYLTDEKILCFWGPLLFEGKCIDSEEVEVDSHVIVRYKVHYMGWNSKHDEWVTDARILKHTPENVLKQTELVEAHYRKEEEKRLQAAQKKSGGTSKVQALKDAAKTSGQKPSNDIAHPPSKKIKKNSDYSDSRGTVDISFASQSELLAQLTLPDALNQQLIDDWNFINNDKKLAPLPRQPSISEILIDFRKVALGKNLKPDVVCSSEQEIKLYFSVALGNSLLYTFERIQYSEVLEAGNPCLADIYGAEHLLRLLKFFPAELAAEKCDVQKLAYWRELIGYLAVNRIHVFAPDYDNVSPGYLRQSVQHF